MLKMSVIAVMLALSSVAAHAGYCDKVRGAKAKVAAKVATVTGLVAAGAGAGVAGTAATAGITAVAHSSAATILTGSGGYIAGTLGAAGAAVASAPVVLIGGVALAGAGGSTWYFCRDKDGSAAEPV